MIRVEDLRAGLPSPVIASFSVRDRRNARSKLPTELRTTVPDPTLIRGPTNEAAADAGDVVVVAVPWEGHEPLVRGLASALVGKIVVDCVNPMGFDAQGAFAP